MRFTVHYRFVEQPNGHPHMRLCETEAEALRVARELLDKDGCRVTFISDADGVGLTEEKIRLKLRI